MDAPSEQNLRPQYLKAVAPAHAVGDTNQVVQTLGECVCHLLVEVGQNVGLPILPSGEDRLKNG